MRSSAKEAEAVRRIPSVKIRWYCLGAAGILRVRLRFLRKNISTVGGG